MTKSEELPSNVILSFTNQQSLIIISNINLFKGRFRICESVRLNWKASLLAAIGAMEIQMVPNSWIPLKNRSNDYLTKKDSGFCNMKYT